LILIARKIINYDSDAVKFKSDEQIDEIISFINSNLDKKLTVNDISNKFFISRYYLMHRFKECTGKTVYSYIQSKKLLKALNNINNGMSSKQACYESGFSDYSVFLKAFKKEFGAAPSRLK
ncbi:MAG: AraC family transcriptional regulator, partial [Eubacterium sp.]|nr:AraC family transcriptional regulator [Eubacterium sp.]